MSTYSGFGQTFEEAFQAAADEAMKAWKPAIPDDMATVRVVESTALYGGFAGFTGVRRVEVELASHGSPKAAMTAAKGTAQMVLDLQALPDIIYANLMPPVRRPQPHRFGLVLTVTNVGDADFQGQSPDSALARFAILQGRTVIWKFPEITATVVTPIVIKPKESKMYTAIWDMPDAVDYVGKELTAVGRFVPSGQSARHSIDVRAAY